MFRNWTNVRLLLEADKGAAGGADKVEESFQKALDKRNNDGVALARELFDDNYQLRRKNSGLSDEVSTLRGKVPAEGASVLNTDEAQAWQVYKALGTHEEVKQAVEQRNQLQGQLEGLQREGAIRDAATAAGFKMSVLLDRDEVARSKGKHLSYAVREVDKDGAKVPVAFVKDGDAEKPLTEYAQEQWADYLPALTVQQQSQGQSNGVRWQQQGTGSGGAQGAHDIAAKFIAEQSEKDKAVANPLLRK